MARRSGDKQFKQTHSRPYHCTNSSSSYRRRRYHFSRCSMHNSTKWSRFTSHERKRCLRAGIRSKFNSTNFMTIDDFSLYVECSLFPETSDNQLIESEQTSKRDVGRGCFIVGTKLHWIVPPHQITLQKRSTEEGSSFSHRCCRLCIYYEFAASASDIPVSYQKSKTSTNTEPSDINTGGAQNHASGAQAAFQFFPSIQALGKRRDVEHSNGQSSDEEKSPDEYDTVHKIPLSADPDSYLYAKRKLKKAVIEHYR